MPDFLKIGAVNGEVQGFAEKRIFETIRGRLQRNQALLASLGGEGDHFVNCAVQVRRGVEDHIF